MQAGPALPESGRRESAVADAFDFTFNASVPKAKVLELATCAFIERHDNVLIYAAQRGQLGGVVLLGPGAVGSG